MIVNAKKMLGKHWKEIADETYKISFDSQGNTFVYDVNLEEGKKIIIIRRKVSQNIHLS